LKVFSLSKCIGSNHEIELPRSNIRHLDMHHFLKFPSMIIQFLLCNTSKISRLHFLIRQSISLTILVSLTNVRLSSRHNLFVITSSQTSIVSASGDGYLVYECV
jgi:hypothetical protein